MSRMSTETGSSICWSSTSRRTTSRCSSVGGTGSSRRRYVSARAIAPASLHTGDFNGDGVVDLVTANVVSNDVSVLLGHGDASFQRARVYRAGIVPGYAEVGDLNGDRRPDVAVANLGSANVSVLLGLGDGRFRRAVSYA